MPVVLADLEGRCRPRLRHLLPQGARVLVATSGGPDSQTLLDLVARAQTDLGWQAVWAAGVDHGLRAEAQVELDLAQELAAAHGVPFHRLSVTLARTGNLLANARRARYAALQGLADDLGATHIALAHTATDQAETVLMNLIRGAGLKGAGGIRSRRGRLVRPLLNATRPEILAYAQRRGLRYAQDPSNTDVRRTRARLRRDVFPALEALNPQAIRNLAAFARRAQGDDSALQSRAAQLLERHRGPSGELSRDVLALPPALCQRVLETWLATHGLRAAAASFRRLRSMRERDALSIGGQVICADRGYLWLQGGAAAFSSPLGIPGQCAVPALGITLTSRLCTPETIEIQADSTTRVAFDADTLHFDLWVRSVRRGDRLRPFGGRGTTKVGDLFTNTKMPRPLRAHWPVVAAGDEVLWVVGLRRGQAAPVGPDTKRVLVVEVEGALPWAAC